MNQDEFNAWADAYFAPETNRLNIFIPQLYVVKDFQDSTNRRINTLKFSVKLKFWAEFRGYEHNPSDLCDRNGRIIRDAIVTGDNSEVNQGPYEMLYIRTSPSEGNGLSIDKSWIDESQPIGLLAERDGLTLRDQFALAALPALIEKYGKLPPTATWAYEVADLMLEARKQEGGEA